MRYRSADPEHVAGRVVDEQRDGETGEERIEHGLAPGAGRDRGQDRERTEHDRDCADAGRGPPDRALDPVADVACERHRAVADGVGDVARATGRRVDPEQEQRQDDRAGGDRSGQAQRRRVSTKAEQQHQVGGGEDEIPPPSAPKRLPPIVTNASAATQDPARPSRAAPTSDGASSIVSSRLLIP